MLEQDAELSLHRDRAAAYRAAVKNIDSEREANAILTAERDAAISAAVAAEREAHAAEIDTHCMGCTMAEREEHAAEIECLTEERDAAIAAAVAAEREACAVVCEGLESLLPGTKTGNMLQWAADQIRARTAT